MHPTTYKFLADDHQQRLLREADAARVATMAARAVSAARAGSNARPGRPRLPFGVVRRLVARLATA